MVESKLCSGMRRFTVVELELSGLGALARVFWRLEVMAVCRDEGLVLELAVVERLLFAWMTWRPTQVEVVMGCDAIRLVLIRFKRLADWATLVSGIVVIYWVRLE